MRVIVNDNFVPVQSSQNKGYDIGFGRGTIDRCSGKDMRTLDGIPETDYNAGYVEGYLDGYCSNDPVM